MCDSDSDSDDWGKWVGSKTEEADKWVGSKTEEAQEDKVEDANEAAIRSSINSWTEWKDMALHDAILKGIYDIAEAKRAQLNNEEHVQTAERSEPTSSEQPKQKYWKRRGTSTRGGSL